MMNDIRVYNIPYRDVHTHTHNINFIQLNNFTLN